MDDLMQALADSIERAKADWNHDNPTPPLACREGCHKRCCNTNQED